MSIEFNKQFFLQGNQETIHLAIESSKIMYEKFLLIESLIYYANYTDARNKIDLIESNLTSTKKEQMILILLLKAICLNNETDKIKAFELISEAENILTKIKNSTSPLQEEFIIFLYIKGVVCYNFQIFEDSFGYFQHCLQESSTSNNKFFQTRSLNRLAKIYFEREMFDQAQEVAMKALAISTANNYFFEIVQGYEMLGLLNQSKNKTQSLRYFEYCLKVARDQLKNDILIARALLNIGKTHLLLKELDKAQHFFSESLNLYSKAAYDTDKPLIMKNLGDVYVRRGNYADAIEYYKKSLSLSEEQDKRPEEGQILFALGSVYFRIRDLKNALKYYQDSLEVKRKTRNKIDMAGSLWGIGHIHFIKRNFEKAMNNYLELYDIYKSFGKAEYVSEILLIIITLQETVGNKEEINKYLALLKQLSQNNYSIHTNLAYSIACGLSFSEDRLDLFSSKFDFFNKTTTNLGINPHFSYFSLLNILQINLLEYLLTGEDSVLEDFRQYTNKLHDFAVANYNYPLEVYSNLILIQLNYIQNKKEMNDSLLVKITVIVEQIKIKPIDRVMTKTLKKIDNIAKKTPSKSGTLTQTEMIQKLGLVNFIKKIIVDKYWL